ncbi:MAG: hypothetical protein JW819_03205 [Candidatus Krumholzibacteriota bacterium]|nr:hypothetical protein [Candidatus Krumholzibacteriota bacterium]
MRIAPAREAALAFLHRDRWLGGDWDSLVAAALARPALRDPRDRRLFSQLVAGAVRLRGRLDARLARLAGREDLDDAVRTALRLALFQLEEMDRLPAHAVVGESVEWVKRRRGPRLAGWVNARLRRYLAEGLPGTDPDPAADPAAYARDVLSFPDWLARRWLAELGTERALAVMVALNERQGTCFRWHAARPGRDAFLAALAAAGAEVERPAGLPLAFRVRGAWPAALREAMARGDLSVQDETAQRVGRLWAGPVLAAGAGEVADPGVAGAVARDAESVAGAAAGLWADLCAAPGGKCCQVAELAAGRPAVAFLALDASERRLEKVVANRDRLGLNRLRVEVGDLAARPPEPAAAVLLDAPCTALGVLADNPDARWRRTPDQIPALAARQRDLLDAAAAWVAPGGRLVYSVCTLTPEETTARRRDFLSRHPAFRPDPVGPGEAPARLITADGELMVWPERGGGQGGYAARFVREEA